MPCPWRGHFPSSGIGKAIFPAHSPSIAQVWVQSKEVLALHPSKGVRIRPPRSTSAGMLASGASRPMSTSSGWVAVWPVTMIKPALSSALDSVMRSTAGGHWLELAIVWCCIASALLARSVMRLTSSATSKSEVGTQSESASTKFTVGYTTVGIGLRGLRHRPKCSGLGPNLCLNWWGCKLQLSFLGTGLWLRTCSWSKAQKMASSLEDLLLIMLGYRRKHRLYRTAITKIDCPLSTGRGSYGGPG